ncbi:MAG: FHA domain-containing protein [Polyangiaceae bacterium]|nr:FHA domain-containing protein [Polyangiaceae bacterium]
MAILCAGAAAFGNDAEGQGLLAEVLRFDPSSQLAKMAFERMEGVSGSHSELDAVIGRYPFEEIAKLERSLRPGVFLRAQVGFNNNVKYKGAEYHIQTEDSGLDKPHVITHLFADGGRIIMSHKRSYAKDVTRPDVTPFVRALMKGQHMEMVLYLREGRFDDIIGGRAHGGMVMLEEPPKVDLDRIGSKKGDKQPQPSSPGPAAQPPPMKEILLVNKKPAAGGEPLRGKLHVVRSLHGGPDFYALRGDESVFGAAGTIQLEGERFCHPKEASIKFDDKGVTILDFDGGNGVYLRIARRVEIGVGDEFVIGDQLLRLERNPDANDGPAPGPTYFRSSLKWPSAFRVTQVFEGGALGAVSMARGTTLQIGSALDYANDLVIRHDPLVAPYHCIIEEQAEAFILTDLGVSSTLGRGSGVFVRLNGRHRLAHGDEILVGRTRLQLDISPSDASLQSLG